MNCEQAKYFGVSERGGAASLQPALRAALERLAVLGRELRPLFAVTVDRSPVMASPGVFWARLDHREHRIWINGYVLDRAPGGPEWAEEFLVQHELLHALRVRVPEAVEPLMEFGFSEEEAADLFAYSTSGMGSS